MPRETGNSATRNAAAWLNLAAAPVFAIMALVACCLGRSPNMLCLSTQHAAWLNGMIPMYGLMSVFHFSPWLKLIDARESRTRQRLEAD